MCQMVRKAASSGVTTDAVAVTGGTNVQATQVCGQDVQRQSVTLINDPDGSYTVYIVASSSQGYTSGIKLKPGGFITLDTTAALWALCPSGAATVYVITEVGAQL